jgi:Uma2 family endonuclease
MGMPLTSHRWTRDEVLALPDDGQRHELVDGELLMSPTPRPAHQVAVMTLTGIMASYVAVHHLGILCSVAADLDLRSGQVVQPDLFVASVDPSHPPANWEEWGVPILVVEVLSPATARFDRLTKRRLYQRSGVQTYWIVDLDARLVEVWTPDADSPVIEDALLAWQPDAAVEPLVIELGRLFGADG